MCVLDSDYVSLAGACVRLANACVHHRVQLAYQFRCNGCDCDPNFGVSAHSVRFGSVGDSANYAIWLSHKNGSLGRMLGE